MAITPIDNIIQDLTGGRPYVLVLMSYRDNYAFYEKIERLVQDELPGLVCVRADRALGGAQVLLEKVHRMIDRAELVLADICKDSDGRLSPNVLYEFGYAVGKGVPHLLMVDSGTEVPTDLKGREVIEYVGTQAGMAEFDRSLREQLRARIENSSAWLRDMLQADINTSHYIIASPRYPGVKSRIHGQKYDSKTFGDNVGIRGLLAAFGATIGETGGVELVSARYCEPNLIEQALNLYLIGSCKANPLAGAVLEEVLRDRRPHWSFPPKEGHAAQGDYPVELCRQDEAQEVRISSEMMPLDDPAIRVHVVDHGVIIRAPHPRHPARTVLVMAGAHSLGTAAACMAATRSRLIRQLRRHLPDGVELGDQQQAIWVLVKGTANKEGMLDEEGVEIVEAGAY